MDRFHAFAEAAVKRAGFGIDPAVIIAIVTAVIQMIGNCPKPTKAAIRSGQISLVQRARVASNILRAGGRGVIGKAAALAQAVCDEALEQQKSFSATAGGGDWCDQMEALATEEG